MKTQSPIQLNSSIEIPIIRKFGRFLSQTKKRINLIYGGAGSGKSYSIAQWFIVKCITEQNKTILITRKTLPSLKLTAYKLFKELLSEYQIKYEENKSDLVIWINSNEVYFKSLDDPEKIKSANFNYVWGEEATELTFDDYKQLNIRTRRKTDTLNQLFFSFNPIDSFHWLKTKVIDTLADNVGVLTSNYKDNPFLSQDYIDELIALKNQDSTYYQIYTLGEWGVLKNLIYSNWDVVDTWPKHDDLFSGLDFGYNNPSALIELLLYDNEIYIRELLYETHLTNTDLIGKMKVLLPKKSNPIYPDSAEPDRIEEIKREGFNVKPAEKDVHDGIDHVKRYKLHIHRDAINVIKEIQSYKWKEDKDGNIIDDPVKFNDHAMDAIRYAIFTHLKTQLTPTIWRLK
jgi:phage terminase large subunit